VDRGGFGWDVAGCSPPDKQPEAIRLVIEQMEAMAPHYVEKRTAG